MIYIATNYVVKTIKEENSDKRIIFLMDSPRNYNDTSLNDSQVLWMHDMLKMICKNNSVELLDLTEYMKLDFQKNNIRFNSEIDHHWNEYSHQFVASVLHKHLFESNE